MLVVSYWIRDADAADVPPKLPNVPVTCFPSSLACLSTGGRRRLLDHGCGSADHERLLGDRDVRRVLGQEPQEHFRDVLLCSEGRLASFGPALELPRERCENRHFKKSPHVK